LELQQPRVIVNYFCEPLVALLIGSFALMSTNNHFYRSAFSERLCAALAGKGLPVHSPTKVSQAFNEANELDPITPQTMRKWMMSGAIPSQGKLLVLAKWLGVSAEWLSFGTGGPVAVSNGEADQVLTKNKLIVVAPEHVQLIPLINRMLQLDPHDLSLVEGMVRLMLEKKRS
jgi:hypothetical protein